MKNHEELFEALLSGEELINGSGGTMRMNQGRLYWFNPNGESPPKGAIFPEEWDLRPRTKNINGVEVPAPRKTAPPMGAEYFTPTVNNASGYRDYVWRGSASDTRRLMAGVIHMEPEHAAQHTKAFLSLTAE